MQSYFWVALGGALGSIGRFACSGWAARLCGETFPWGTLLVNVVGSLAIGFVSGLSAPEGRWFLPFHAREFVMIGLCGGYTTFSSFSLQTLNQIRSGEWLAAAGNILSSVFLCLLAVWLGSSLAAKMNS